MNAFLVPCLVLALALTGAAPAGSASVRPQTAGAAARPPAPHGGAITGYVWNFDGTPVSGALVRLRHLGTGRIVRGAQADGDGRFRFPAVAPGDYAVELVDEGGAVRAVGQMLHLGHAETVATFIRLGARTTWFDGFFANAAAAVVASAASLGVTAMGQSGQPASPRF